MTSCPTSWAGGPFIKSPLPLEPYEGLRPDFLVENAESMNLPDFGVDGLVRQTAGHSPGSIAVERSSKNVVVGDLTASGIRIGGIAFTGHAIRPPFEDDPQKVARELDCLVQEGAKRFYMGHGGPLEGETVIAAEALNREAGFKSRRLMQTQPITGLHAPAPHAQLRFRRNCIATTTSGERNCPQYAWNADVWRFCRRFSRAWLERMSDRVTTNDSFSCRYAVSARLACGLCVASEVQ